MIPWLDTPEIMGAENIPHWTPEQRGHAINMISWVINRIFDKGRGTIDALNADDKGIYLCVEWDEWHRGHRTESHRDEYIIPWDVFLSECSLEEYLRKQDAIRKEAKKAEEKRREEAASKQRTIELEQKERELYKLLHSKYGGT